MKQHIIIRSKIDLTEHQVNNKYNVEEIYLQGNANYEITEEIDLQQKRIVMPESCDLIFNGGGLLNGTLVGDNTGLFGDVRVEHLEGSFSTPIRSSYSVMQTDADKLKQLLTLDVKTLILDEDFAPAFSSGNDPMIRCNNIEYLIGEDITISATNTGSPFCLIQATKLKELSGITFDGNNQPFIGLITIVKDTQDHVTVENVTVRNITNDSALSHIKGISIEGFYPEFTYPVLNCIVTLRNISMSNLWQRGNNTITDEKGSVTSLYMHINAGHNVSVKIDKCWFEDIHCYEGTLPNKTIKFEDAVGIYVSSSFSEGCDTESNNIVEISNIHGHNFGKRLVKTDCANLSIRNIMGTNEYFDFMCLVGMNASIDRFKYAHVENILYDGVVGYQDLQKGSFALSTSMSFTTVENIVSRVTGFAVLPHGRDIQQVSGNIPTFYPVEIAADHVTIRDLQMIGAQTIRIPDRQNIRFENVTYDDTTGTPISYSSGILMPSLNASAVFDGFKVKSMNKKKLIACNYLTEDENNSNITIRNADIEFINENHQNNTVAVEGTNWESGTQKHILNLTLKDCIFRKSENFNRFPFRKLSGRWTLENITFEYSTVPSNLPADTIALGGYFKVKNDANQCLTIKNIYVLYTNGECTPLTRPVLYLESDVSGSVATEVSLANIRSNLTTNMIALYNVCWGEYIDATVARNLSNLFGAEQKGFMVKDFSTKKKYVWSGTAWIELSV